MSLASTRVGLHARSRFQAQHCNSGVLEEIFFGRLVGLISTRYHTSRRTYEDGRSTAILAPSSWVCKTLGKWLSVMQRYKAPKGEVQWIPRMSPGGIIKQDRYELSWVYGSS